MSDAAARERPPRKLARKLWIVAAAALGLFFLYTLWPRPQTVTVAVVGRGKVQHEIVDEGRTRIRDVYTVAAPVGGAGARARAATHTSGGGEGCGRRPGR